MAAKKQTNGFDARPVALMIYLSIAVAMVVLTVVLAFADQAGNAAPEQTASAPATATVSSGLLTLQAEDRLFELQLTHEGQTRSMTSTP